MVYDDMVGLFVMLLVLFGGYVVSCWGLCFVFELIFVWIDLDFDGDFIVGLLMFFICSFLYVFFFGY